MATWQQQYLDRFYRSKPDYVDGTTEFFELVRASAPATGQVLELGAGPTNDVSAFLADSFAAVDGLDIDEACRDNNHLRNAYVYDGGDFPIKDETYDAVICNYVLEHIEKPSETLREIRRVLRPGGVFIFRAPNQWHYISLVARMTPHWFHELVANRLRNLPDEAEDPYPTYYRMNSCRRLRKLFAAADFGQCEMRTIEKAPSYGMSLKPLFLLFMMYERIVNSSEIFAGLRVNILGVFRKPLQ